MTSHYVRAPTATGPRGPHCHGATGGHTRAVPTATEGHTRAAPTATEGHTHAAPTATGPRRATRAGPLPQCPGSHTGAATHATITRHTHTPATHATLTRNSHTRTHAHTHKLTTTVALSPISFQYSTESILPRVRRAHSVPL